MNQYVNGISTAFIGKTTKHARIRPLGGNRVSKTSHLPNYRRHNLAEAVLCINLGHIAAAGVVLKPPKAYKSWFQLEEAPRYVLLQVINLMILYFWKTGENKIFHFVYFCFFFYSHDFELLKSFILF